MQEEIHWHQRAKKHWLKAGDKNTAFFHNCTKSRRVRNNIEKPVDEDGHLKTSEEEIKGCFKRYFSSLFSSSNPSWEAIEQALRFTEMKVSESINHFLDADFGEDEIRKVAFDIGSTKAPGPDGFSAEFFHKT